ncbi:MAG: proton-conducting transporter membrane subunit [Candidatus Aphodomonas sp.]|nr:proton-conducting transporter membrane subunit [Candidatus Aphodomonas sp.]
MMEFWQNIPMLLVVFSLMSAAICSVLPGKVARVWLTAATGLACAASAFFLAKMLGFEGDYVYKMGEFGAPYGNELRCGRLEAVVALTFTSVLFLAVLGGAHRISTEVDPQRRPLFCTVSLLLQAALIAMTYTNDMFTGYVFIEITTIAACALICVKSRGRTMFAATRYMIMNLIGSGLFLFGLCMMYCLTGHLLFPQLKEQIALLAARGRYGVPLYTALILMGLGIAIKAGLYPFHTWIPNAYSSATPSAAAMLSSLVSKTYIFLLLKAVWRVFGPETFQPVGDVLFVFSMLGIVMGSVEAIFEHNVRRMVAWSSVAQIGYIFMALSLCTREGAAAAVFHIAAHSCAKSTLFLSAGRLVEVSGGKSDFRDLRGAGLRAPLAGAAFSVGAMSIVGIPVLGGFASKVFLVEAALQLSKWKCILMLAVLAVSVVLNVAYFLRTVLTLYRDPIASEAAAAKAPRAGAAFCVSMSALIGLSVALGVCGGTVMNWIRAGAALL